jgi:hypothetical protein
MSTRKVPTAVASAGYSDDTAPRLRAYLANVRPLRGIADLYGNERYQSGRSLIERMALSADGEGVPTLRLTTAQCADVLHFMHFSEPVNLSYWFQEPEDAPSHLAGQAFVLEAWEVAMRTMVEPPRTRTVRS